jgi:hypothetical protein
LTQNRSEKAPEKLVQLQRKFTSHLRDPEGADLPEGIEDRRMAVYRDNVFRGNRRLLAANFSVLRSLYGDGEWDRLIRNFLRHHRSRTPLFPRLPQEFLNYLQEEHNPADEDPPFLLELAHWEWVQKALLTADREVEAAALDPDGDLLSGTPLVSPLAQVCSYTFAVHEIGADNQPAAPPELPTHLLAYRNRKHQVRVMGLNAISVLLLARLQENEASSGETVLRAVASEIGHADADAVIAHGRALLEDWRARDVILGTCSQAL